MPPGLCEMLCLMQSQWRVMLISLFTFSHLFPTHRAACSSGRAPSLRLGVWLASATETGECISVSAGSTGEEVYREAESNQKTRELVKPLLVDLVYERVSSVQ